MKRRQAITCTPEQRQIIMDEYEDCVDTKALAERLGMITNDVRVIANRMKLRKSQKALSIIAQRPRYS